MRIVCLGGGPAGLYFAILMKKANPSHDITVIERNAADNTFGWGVVFSDQTMDGFREADPHVVEAIEAATRLGQGRDGLQAAEHQDSVRPTRRWCEPSRTTSTTGTTSTSISRGG